MNSARKKTFTKIINKNMHRLIPVASLVLVLGAFSAFSNVTLAYEVKIDGKTLGYVADQSVVTKANDKINKQLVGNNIQLTTSASYQIKMVSANKLSDADSISSAIIDSDNDVAQGYGIYKNNKLICAAKTKKSAEDSLEMLKKLAMRKTKAVAAEFVENIEVKSGLFSTDDLLDNAKLGKALKAAKLSVKSVSNSTKNETVKFTKVTVEDPARPVGYKKVLKGVNGTNKIVTQTVYIDGKKQSSEIIATKEIKRAAAERTIIGTKADAKTAVKQQFCWPVQKNYSGYVSTFFGEDGHGGIDIATIAGTPIYAAQTGTVAAVYQNASNGYGNYFIIDHGNGLRTLYAHCTDMYVKVGQKVVMGQEVATVGSTGRSTGNHLHFEVHLNNYRVDPAPYVGLKTK